jgi:ABC-type thiamin/hydroxymethylpyrimidine transport system permease subunit
VADTVGAISDKIKRKEETDKMKKELKLTDILVTIVIAIAFGIVYILWGTVYYAVQPLGLHLDQLLYGMWFIAGTVAYFIIRKPGVALLAEIAAASGEFLLGVAMGSDRLAFRRGARIVCGIGVHGFPLQTF